MLRIGTLIMFLVAIGVAYGTTLALDLLVDRSASDTAETKVDADAIFGSTEPAKLTASCRQAWARSEASRVRSPSSRRCSAST